MNSVIHIALVDDEALFLEGISLLCSSVKHIHVSQTANDGLEFLNVLRETPKADLPDIALVDIQMKPMDGFELVEILKDEYPDLKIIILSSHYKSNVVGNMIKLGVSAFIPKNADKKLLITAIESVDQYGVYFTQKDQEMLSRHMQNKSKKSAFNQDEELSKRETEILELICHEYTNQEVADKLYLSKRTVEGHRQRMMEKIGAKNTVGLVVYAFANQIHPLSQKI